MGKMGIFVRYIKRSMKKYSLGIVLLMMVLAGVMILPAVKSRIAKEKRSQYEQYLRAMNRKAPLAPKTDKESPEAADLPEMAAFQDFLMTMDPSTGTVPRERLITAYRETERKQQEKSGDAALAWTEHSSNMGGRTRMIMYDPNDATHKKVWAGGVTGGLWYNDNIQNSNSPWVPVGDFWPDLAIRCMTYDPNNPLILYIGTGEAETAMQTYRESSGLGDGIWRSLDGGVTWDLMPSTTQFAYVTKILVRNESGNSVIYAGIASGLYQGTHQSLPTDGLYRSADNGTTWTQVLPNITGKTVPYAVSDIALAASGRIFVGTRPNLNGDGAATILYSDNGTGWTVNEDYLAEILVDPQYYIPGRVVLAAAPSDPNVVYALIASGFINGANNFNYYYCFHILRSANNGVTWTKQNLPNDLTSGVNFATIAWHALDIAVDPNNANNIYAGGLDMHHSVNGGTSWTRVSDWSLMYGGGGPMYIHADQHTIVFKPGSSTEILFGSDGGVFYTSNGTAISPSFEQHNTGYNTLQFYSGAIKPVSGADYYLGGLQDNGCLYYTGSPLTINDMVSGGDGALCFYDLDDPTHSISSLYYNVYYTYSNGQYLNYIGDYQSGIFVSPSDLDYKLNALYANATDYVGNFSNTILRINNMFGSPSGTFVSLNTNNPVYYSFVRYSPYSPAGKATLFLGTQSGRLFKVTEAQSNSPVVAEITGTNFPTGNVSCIAIGGSEDTLMVTFSNYGVSSVFQSYDGGITWQDKDTNLPDMPIRYALYHPDNAAFALLGTETGVWSTHNLNQSGTTWTPDVIGMANVRTDMLTFRKSDLTVLAVTHGRGLFTAIWDVHEGIAGHAKPVFTIYPNPTTGKIELSGDISASSFYTVKIYDPKGTMIHSEDVPANGKVIRTIDLSGLPRGPYLLHLLKNGQDSGTQKIILQ
jgi:hypothetical protein